MLEFVRLGNSFREDIFSYKSEELKWRSSRNLGKNI